MSKVRINDLAREMEVKSRQILDVLGELGLGEGKTHSSSIEEHEAEKVRAQFERGSRAAGHGNTAASRAPQGIQPKIDLSHVSKPGDVMKAILAKQQETEAEARRGYSPSRPPQATPPQAPAKAAPPVVSVAAPSAAPARPEPRKIMPPVRQAPNIVVPPPPPAIATRPPTNPVVAKAPVGATVVARPAVAVAPPHVAVVVKPPVPQAPRSPEPPPPAPAKPQVHAATVAPAAPGAPAHAAPAHAAPVVVAPPPAPPVVEEVSTPVSAAIIAPEPVQEPIPAVPFTETADAASEADIAAAADEPAASPRERVHHVPTAPPAPPARRVVMPQTGPRPVYKAPFCLRPHPHHQPQRQLQEPAFSVAAPSLTADLPAHLAAIRSAPPADLPFRVNSPADRAPSIPHAPRPAAMPALVALAALPEPVLASAHALALAAHPVRVASAEHAPAVPAALHPQAKHLVRSVPTRPKAAVDAPSIPRRRKAR